MRRFLITLLCLAPWLTQAQLESTSDLQRGLVGWWRFNEGTGTNAFDLSGNANTGTLSGSTIPVWTNGVFGGALSFDGSSSYVSAGTNVGNFNSTDLFSVTTWLKAKTLGSNNHEILCRSTAIGDNAIGWHVRVTTANLLRFYFGNNPGSNFRYSDSASITTGVWYHVVGVWNGVQTKIYINGATDSSHVNTGSLGVTTSASTLLIGEGEVLGTFFPGIIDDVRIYNRALSATEVLNLYCQGGGRTP